MSATSTRRKRAASNLQEGLQVPLSAEDNPPPPSQMNKKRKGNLSAAIPEAAIEKQQQQQQDRDMGKEDAPAGRTTRSRTLRSNGRPAQNPPVTTKEAAETQQSDEESSPDKPAVKRKATSKPERPAAKGAVIAPKASNKPVAAAAPAAGGATREMEEQLWQQGYASVVGVDEAGRGPLAGPVVAAACCLPPGVVIPGVNDSKQLDEKEREALYAVITTTPGVVWATHVVDHTTIDRINILQATMVGMTEAVKKLPAGQRDYLLIDGNRLPKDLPAPAKAVVKGDARVFCIAAASILAKVTRDRIMLQYHETYPQYNFARHKGYAVPAHYTALNEHGVSAIHRRSFQPVRGMTGWTREAQLQEEEAQAAAQRQAEEAAEARAGGVVQDQQEVRAVEQLVPA